MKRMTTQNRYRPVAGTADEVVAETAVAVVAGTAVFFLIIMVLDFSENSSNILETENLNSHQYT